MPPLIRWSLDPWSDERHNRRTRLVDPLVVSGPLLFAQHELLYLAGRSLRQVAELHGNRTLIARQVPPAELDDLRVRGAEPWLERHERFGALTPRFVGDRHDGTL